MRFFVNIILLILFIAILTSCSKKIVYIGEKNNSIPVTGLSPFAISISINDLNLPHMAFISKVYTFGIDTFMITSIDKNSDNLFSHKDDIVVISSSKDVYVPILPEVNPNATGYKTELVVSFKENVYRIDSISKKGYIYNLQYLGETKKTDEHVHATYSDFIDLKLSLELLDSDKKITLSDLLGNTSKKYIYFNFWSSFCAQCFEDIPILMKLIKSDIEVINIAYWQETKEQINETMNRFEYPGKHYIGNARIVKNFAQSGFPFGTLVEVSSGQKVVLGSNFKEDILTFLSIK